MYVLDWLDSTCLVKVWNLFDISALWVFTDGIRYYFFVSDSLYMSSRYCSAEPLPTMPRVGSKKTVYYDEPWNDDLLDKLENLQVDQTLSEADLAKKRSKTEGVFLP